MLALARLAVILFIALAAFVESSAGQDPMSSMTADLLRDLHIDEIVGDVGAEHVIVRGSLGRSDEHGQLTVEVECNGDKGSAIIRDPALSTQDLYPANRRLCDDLIRGLRERDHPVGRDEQRTENSGAVSPRFETANTTTFAGTIASWRD